MVRPRTVGRAGATVSDLSVRSPDYCDVCGGPHYSHLLSRLGWAWRTARHAEPLSFDARLRLLWHDFVLHGLVNRGGERCQDCGRDYPAWWANDAEWIDVMGYPSGLLCQRCFDRRRAGRP